MLFDHFFKRMFYSATSFNTDISSWETTKVTTMKGMFSDAFIFNGNISGWITSEVMNMHDMFYGAISFNIDISSWETSKVTNMRVSLMLNLGMFHRLQHISPFL